MSLPQWALDAGADPEIGWVRIPFSPWLSYVQEGSRPSETRPGERIYTPSKTVGIAVEGNELLIERNKMEIGGPCEKITIELESPAQAIRAAEGLIRALRGDA
jgi:hypothetical protein